MDSMQQNATSLRAPMAPPRTARRFPLMAFVPPTPSASGLSFSLDGLRAAGPWATYWTCRGAAVGPASGSDGVEAIRVCRPGYRDAGFSLQPFRDGVLVDERDERGGDVGAPARFPTLLDALLAIGPVPKRVERAMRSAAAAAHT
jgi:hypothetical protein